MLKKCLRSLYLLVMMVLFGMSMIPQNIKVNAGNIGETNTISIYELTDNIKKIHWQNNTKSLSTSDKEFFNGYGVNYEEALSSTNVFVQSQLVEFDEIISKDAVFDGNVSLLNIGDSGEDEFIHNKGYVKFTTIAYQLGFYDGGIVYHIEETVQQLKDFIIHQNDNLIIRHGNNSATLNIDGYEATGSLFTPCAIRWFDGSKTNIDEFSKLTPDFSVSDGGVVYTFKVGGMNLSTDAYDIVYGNSTVKGDYYIVATDTTEIQPVYIHNKSWFVSSLSVSFGPIGVSVDTNGSSDIMYGSCMTLKGYDDRIQTSVLALQPNEYGFEPQYFFYEKNLHHNIYGWEFDTKRLRTGYIEEQYVNLSPNRQGAGQAYLEFNFQIPVYEFSTYLSFWSEFEKYTVNDTAYIQYKDKNGNWITILDLLNCNLPTDRTNQKHFEFEIIEGTYSIRFISNVTNATSDRNKGRICIGEMKFVNWKIN